MRGKLFFLTLLLPFFLITCGIGNNNEKIKITKATVEDFKRFKAVSYIYSKITTNMVSVSIFEIDENTSRSFKNIIGNGIILNYFHSVPNHIHSILKNPLFKYKSIHSKGQDSEERFCEEGGKKIIKLFWTNPDCELDEHSEACFENNEITIIYTYLDCIEDDKKINGKIKVYMKFLNGELLTYKISIDKISVKSPKHSLTLKNSFIEKNSDSNAHLYSLKLNGEEQYKDYNYKFIYSDLLINLKEADNFMEVKCNGGIKIYEDNSKTIDIKLKNFAESIRIFDDVYYKINGYFYEGVCLGKWLKFETKQDLKYKPWSECPIEGKIVINNNLKISYTSSGGAIVKDGSDTYYESCKDLEGDPSICNVDFDL